MKVLIVDDDSLVAMSLKTILSSDDEIEVVGLGNDGSEAVRLYEEHNPDVLLMDIRMSGMSGLDAGSEILSKHSDARILYLTTFNDDEYIIQNIENLEVFLYLPSYPSGKLSIKSSKHAILQASLISLSVIFSLTNFKLSFIDRLNI